MNLSLWQPLWLTRSSSFFTREQQRLTRFTKWTGKLLSRLILDTDIFMISRPVINLFLWFRTLGSHEEASLMKWKHQHTSKLMILHATNHPWPYIKSALLSLKTLNISSGFLISDTVLKILEAICEAYDSKPSGDLSCSDPELFARSISEAPRLMFEIFWNAI